MAMPPSNNVCKTAWAQLAIIAGPKPQRTQNSKMGSIARSMLPPQGNLYRRVNVKLDPTFVQEVVVPERPKSKLEIFNEMAERNQYIMKLKKELNLIID